MKRYGIAVMLGLAAAMLVLSCKSRMPAGLIGTDALRTPTATPAIYFGIKVEDSATPEADVGIIVAYPPPYSMSVSGTTSADGWFGFTVNAYGTYDIELPAQEGFPAMYYEHEVTSSITSRVIDRGSRNILCTLNQGHAEIYDWHAKSIVYTISYQAVNSRAMTLSLEGLDESMYSFSPGTLVNNGDTSQLTITVPQYFQVDAGQLTFSVRASAGNDGIQAAPRTIYQNWYLRPVWGQEKKPYYLCKSTECGASGPSIVSALPYNYQGIYMSYGSLTLASSGIVNLQVSILSVNYWNTASGQWETFAGNIHTDNKNTNGSLDTCWSRLQPIFGSECYMYGYWCPGPESCENPPNDWRIIHEGGATDSFRSGNYTNGRVIWRFTGNDGFLYDIERLHNQ